MNILNQKVIHKTLGEGIITEQTSSTISVLFSSGISKKFLFPSAFESFLSFADSAFQTEVLIFLEKQKKEKEQKAAAEKQKRREEKREEEKDRTGSRPRNNVIHMERKERRKNEGLRNSTTIRVEDGYLFDRSVDVLNECFGKDYKGWQRGGYDLKFDGIKIGVWFPKMAVYEYGIEKSQSSTANIINTLSADGTTIREYFPDLNGLNIDETIRITFAKFPGEPYRYVGTFVADPQASTPKERIYRRIATEIDLKPWK